MSVERAFEPPAGTTPDIVGGLQGKIRQRPPHLALVSAKPVLHTGPVHRSPHPALLSYITKAEGLIESAIQEGRYRTPPLQSHDDTEADGDASFTPRGLCPPDRMREWADCFEALRPDLVRLIRRRRGHQAHDINDIVQSVGVKLLEALDRGGVEGKVPKDTEGMRATIIKSTLNATVDFYRKNNPTSTRRKGREVFLEDLTAGEQRVVDYKTSTSIENERYADLDVEDILVMLLPELKETNATIVVMRVMWGISSEDIASILGIKSNAVRQLFHRLRKKVETILVVK